MSSCDTTDFDESDEDVTSFSLTPAVTPFPLGGGDSVISFMVDVVE